ncbi:hypothetical protein ACO1O0_008552 [Amphichorda felina]
MFAKIVTFALFSVALAAPSAPLEKRETGSTSYFTPGLGACGWTNGEGDMIAAIDSGVFDSQAPCGRMVRVTGAAGTADVQIVDRCPGCGPNGLDLSPTAFQMIVGSLDIGRADTTWEWI